MYQLKGCNELLRDLHSADVKHHLVHLVSVLFEYVVGVKRTSITQYFDRHLAHVWSS